MNEINGLMIAIDGKEYRISSQMCHEERVLIYRIVRTIKPVVCVECGTMHAAGSTLFIAAGLYDNIVYDGVKGCLHTYEIDPTNAMIAREFIKTVDSDIADRFEMHEADFADSMSKILRVDFALLDGKECPEDTMRGIMALENLMRPGSVIVLHDWKTAKCSEAQKYLTTRNKWKVCLTLDTETGMAVAIKL